VQGIPQYVGKVFYCVALPGYETQRKFISLISLISVLGVAIGVMALIVVIAVMTGFDIDLRDKIIGNYSHITIAKYDGMNTDEYEALVRKIRMNPHVVAVSPFVQGQVLVSEGRHFYGPCVPRHRP